MKYVIVCGLLVVTGLLAGCSGRPSLLPNTDPNLRKNSTQFAADAAKRHPYKSDAPSGGEALCNAQYDLTFGTVQILNYANEDYDDVEVWVNKNFVVYIPKLEKGKERVKVIPFTMLFDDSGNPFSTDSGKNPIKTVEIYRKGKMYNVPVKLAD